MRAVEAGRCDEPEGCPSAVARWNAWIGETSWGDGHPIGARCPSVHVPLRLFHAGQLQEIPHPLQFIISRV